MSNWALASGTAFSTTSRIVVTPSATAHTKGAWTTVFATLPVGVTGLFISTVQSSAQFFPRMLVDIGIGAAGSEVVVVPNLVISSFDQYRDGGKHSILPIALPPNQRLAIRMQTDLANPGTFTFELTCQRGTPMTPVGGLITTYGVNTATTLGTNVTAGANFAHGTAVQFVASTPYRSRGLAITMFGSDGATDGYFIGSRVVYGATTVVASPTFNHCVYGLETRGSHQMINFVPCDIPAGSDLRIQSYNLDGFTPRRGYVLYLLH